MILEEDSRISLVDQILNNLLKQLNRKIDRYILFQTRRWIFTGLLIFIYIFRIYLIGGFYVVTYMMGLYNLHLIVQFLTPKGLPEYEEDEDHILPSFRPQHQENDSEAKPLIRSVGEFHFWKKCTFSVIIALTTSLSRLFDLPVFWPFLLFYFSFLCFITVKRQLKQMKKYNYSIFDFSKRKLKQIQRF